MENLSANTGTENFSSVSRVIFEEQMTEPISIYRFLDCNAALKTLEVGEFRVGLLSKFNDPFEWRLGFTGIITPEEQTVADKLSSDHQPWMESWMGIMCFSDSVSDPVLWSLYAEKHRGVAFEVKYAWNSKDEHLFKMTYSNERPVLNFSQLSQLRKHCSQAEGDAYLKDLLDRLRKQKSPGFSFEREYRLSIDLRDKKHCQFKEGNYYWQLPKNSLKRVILEFRCPLEEGAVKNLLNVNGLSETKVTQAEMSSQTYSIQC
jgi:hypothetical protein